MIKQAIIWGLGGTTRDFLDKKGFHRDLDIIAFTDNNHSLWNTAYKGIPVIPPSELKNMGYDAIIICSLYHKEIRNHIEKAKKVYLIQPNPLWMQALQRTFQPYRNKVVFCSKFVGKQDSADTITIDSLVSERADFIKMDIEGAELDALAGAKRTLEDSHAKCAICSYHRWHDEKAIRKMLEGYGYTTSTSKGYMFFPYDENIMDTLDLRRGVVYGDKDEEAE